MNTDKLIIELRVLMLETLWNEYYAAWRQGDKAGMNDAYLSIKVLQ